MQAEHTHSPTPQPGEAGRSRNPSPNTHTHTAHPWPGVAGCKWSTHTAQTWSSALNSTIGTWAKPLSRMAPHLFGHTKIYNMGVSISNIYYAYNTYPQNMAPTMICHVPPLTQLHVKNT